ncbi:hypothetical protein SAMN04488498_11211 [Mesorhizobium albiziae]|uniref:Piwi domain-containing protein n=1 Tax=Neomesorhizobium albiziae TaxID=335020 RepID=A0A1I4C4P9_9HYPH|nr:hypothetical protein [Mesorhizobium albiziae]GLS29416.1 hypothetical protein GCM10007937_11240 [Mesorhizobium albiziae]SFK76078.1 hypothetical protein SAMN04488498_11211 [Mesorhizobium albiziae]
MFRVHQLDEPLLRVGHDQALEAPKDGLFLFGPVERTPGLALARVGVIGTSTGLGLAGNWMQRLAGWIPGKMDRRNEPVIWAPAWPGFEACFGVGLPERSLANVAVDGAAVEAAIKRSNRADAVRTAVKIFADAIRAHLRTEEQRPDLWLVVIPDVVYRYGRPEVAAPPRAERRVSDIISARAAKRFFEGGDLFPETMEDAETYLFSSNFHHQLKAELLIDQIALQLVLESTLADRSIVDPHRRPRGLQDEATVAWNFGTTLYFKMGSKPWALANVRPGVCYVGLVFKRNETPHQVGEACCAAQMFLDSGDGLVFRGALGPWYSDKNREYHLSSSAAQQLMSSVILGYEAKHGHPPAQLFIHGRHRFNEAEWAGFKASVPSETSLVGVRIQRGDDMRLFRPTASTPVLRGTAVEIGAKHAFLWTRGYVPRLASYQGFETPKPLSVQITHGEGDLAQVLADVLALTKVNYNACDFASGLPVTLKFADRVGEILMASPKLVSALPLPFRYYV